MEKTKKAYKKPEMAFVDTEKHTVSGSPEMVEHFLPKLDQIIERLAEEGMALELSSNLNH